MKFIDNVDKDKFNEFVNNHENSHFMQSVAWGEFCQIDKNQIPHFVGLTDDDDTLVATALIMEKKTPFGYSYGYAPRGFITDYNNYLYVDEFTKHLKDYMKKNKMIYLRINPAIKYQDIDFDANKLEDGFNNYELFNHLLSLGYKHTGFYKLYQGNLFRYTYKINLEKPWEEIESNFNKSFLKAVKKSNNYDLEIDNELRVEDFYNLMKLNSEKDGFESNTLKHYEEFTKLMARDKSVKFFNITIDIKKELDRITNELNELNELIKESPKKKLTTLNDQKARLEKERDVFTNFNGEKKLICSLICTYTAKRAWSLYIGSDDLANLTGAVSRSYYEAIKNSYDEGYKEFDLFGTVGDPNTTYKNLAALNSYKSKFGTEYVEFIGEFDLINNKLLYKVLPILLGIYRKLRR